MKKIKLNWKKIGLAGLTLITATAIGLTPVYVNNIEKANIVKKSTNYINIETKEEQVKFFENVEMSDVEDYIFENDIIHGIETQSSSFSRIYSKSESIDVEQELLNSINGVMNGDILISSIENEFLANVEGYEEYQEQYEMLNSAEIVSDSLIQDENEYVTESNDNHIQAFSMSSRSSDDLISGLELKQLEELVEYKESLQIIVGLNKTIEEISIVTTAISWGVAAFYWAAWWMFGGNVPFALAATLQATTLTVSTALAVNNNKDLEKELRNLNYIIPIHLHNTIKKVADSFIPNFEANQDIYFSYLDFSLAAIDAFAIGAVVDRFVSAGVAQARKHISTNLSKYLVVQKIKKKVLLSTSWVSPISTAISYLDFVLSAVSFAADIAFVFIK